MNPADLQRKLIAAARVTPPDDRVPYAFEKRIMARLEGARPADALALWGHALSRAAICSIALVILLGGLAFFIPQSTASTEPLSQTVDQTLVAAVNTSNADQDTW